MGNNVIAEYEWCIRSPKPYSRFISAVNNRISYGEVFDPFDEHHSAPAVIEYAMINMNPGAMCPQSALQPGRILFTNKIALGNLQAV